MVRKALLTAVIAAATIVYSGCTELSDSLPDSYYETDIVETEESLEETTLTTTLVTTAKTTRLTETEAETAVGFETETVTSITTAEETEPVTTTTVQTTTEETAAETTVQITSETEQMTVLTIPETEMQTETTAAQITEEVTEAVTEAAGQVSSGYYPENNYYALNFDRQKGVWISYLEYDRMMKNCSKSEFTSELQKCFDNIVSIGCNTVYFQVRVYGDAYYSSELFPTGDRLTGGYDPFAIAVKEAHDRGLSIHAWINPMRLMTDSQMSGISEKYLIGEWYNSSKNGSYIVSVDGRYYLNPAYDEVVTLICDGIREILFLYNADGIQIDDYFYPTTNASFDKAAYEASGTALSLADWRRSNISRMVKRMYNAVHSVNSTAVFGISPQGNLSNNYNDLYADIYTWCAEEGYCDYICPQIYFGFDNSTLPYAETVNKWYELVKTRSVKLVIGLAAYKSGTVDSYAGNGKYEWANNTDILSRQSEYTDIYGAGYAYFRYDSLFTPEQSVAASVNAELENIKK